MLPILSMDYSAVQSGKLVIHRCYQMLTGMIYKIHSEPEEHLHIHHPCLAVNSVS